MLIRQIKADKFLNSGENYISAFCQKCEENGVEFYIDDDINTDDYVLISPDSYYMSGYGKKRQPTPKAADCLVFQKCADEKYRLTIVELKRIKKAKRLDVNDVIEKFENCLRIFVETDFSDYFNRDYQDWQLIFVSSLKRRDPVEGERLHSLMNQPLKFRNQRRLIKIKRATDNPILEPCDKTNL